MPGEVENKYGGLLEKKWTSVIRLQKKVIGVFILKFKCDCNLCKTFFFTTHYYFFNR